MPFLPSVLDFLLIPNLVYLLLIAGVWAIVLAVLVPGTGVVELFGAICVLAAGLGFARLGINPWGAGLIVLGLALFVAEFRRPRRGLFLAASGLALAVGSIFLFPSSGTERVSPLLAIATTLLTVGYFWIAVRKSAQAQGTPPKHALPDAGARGEVRSEINPEGTVYVDGELWTAVAEEAIRVGEKVVVVHREGLKLKVAKTV